VACQRHRYPASWQWLKTLGFAWETELSVLALSAYAYLRGVSLLLALSATPHTPTLSSTASFTTPIASISPAKASDADAQDRSQGIDHQPATLPKIYCQQGARQPGDIISYRRATSSRNQRATSSESAGFGMAKAGSDAQALAAALGSHDDIDDGLAAYNKIRQPIGERIGSPQCRD
jgi:hypothetical protein